MRPLGNRGIIAAVDAEDELALVALDEQPRLAQIIDLAVDTQKKLALEIELLRVVVPLDAVVQEDDESAADLADARVDGTLV